MWRPPLAPGLLWQSWLLCWLLGLLAARWPGPALCAGLCVLVADSRLWRLPRLLLGAGIALLGCLAAQALLPDLSPPPALETLLEGRIPTRRWPVLEAGIADVRTLPDQRLRISLTDLRLLRADGQPLVRLPGKASWTWEEPQAFPLPGQTVRLQRKLLPLDGQRNAGLTDWGFWWRSHGTGWRLWSRSDDGGPVVSGQPSAAALQRLELMRRFLGVLLPDRACPLPPAAGAGPQAAAADAQLPTPAPVPQGKAILLALLFGERFLLDTATVQAFNAGNLSHSLALSGQHLLVAGLAGMFLVWLAARLHPGLYLWRPRHALIPLAACPAALAYLWLGNAPPSLLRAAGMLLLLALGLTLAHLRCAPLPRGLRERLPAGGLDILCATLLCITLLSPLAVFDTGLQLSALCVAVICCATPLMGRILRRIPRERPFCRRVLRPLAGILLVSFLIQLALLPLSLLLFNNSGLWFMLNVLWLPVLGSLVLPGAFLGLGLSLCGLPQLAVPVLEAAALPCQWLVDGLLFLQEHGWLEALPVLRPHWTALPAMACLFLAAALKAGRPALPPAGKRLLACGLLLTCVGPALRLQESLGPRLELSIPDTGQAQALLLRPPHGRTLLIDAAGSTSRRWNPGREILLPLLADNRRPGLDAVILSHPDIDHAGGLPPLLAAFPHAPLLHNGQPGTGRMADIWQALPLRQARNALHTGDVIRLGDPGDGLLLQVLHPPRPEAGRQKWQGNSASLVLRLVRHGRGLALLPGDADAAALRRLLDSGQELRADVLVAPHHGSDGSFLPQFLDAVQPRLVVASCGAHNRFGHPGRKLRQWLDARHVPLLQTGLHGHVRLVWPLPAPLPLLRGCGLTREGFRPLPGGTGQDALPLLWWCARPEQPPNQCPGRHPDSPQTSPERSEPH